MHGSVTYNQEYMSSTFGGSEEERVAAILKDPNTKVEMAFTAQSIPVEAFVGGMTNQIDIGMIAGTNDASFKKLLEDPITQALASPGIVIKNSFSSTALWDSSENNYELNRILNYISENFDSVSSSVIENDKWYINGQEISGKPEVINAFRTNMAYGLLDINMGRNLELFTKYQDKINEAQPFRDYLEPKQPVTAIISAPRRWGGPTGKEAMAMGQAQIAANVEKYNYYANKGVLKAK
jgi:hypothetical protein